MTIDTGYVVHKGQSWSEEVGRLLKRLQGPDEALSLRIEAPDLL
jgi:hypothetical protein